MGDEHLLFWNGGYITSSDNSHLTPIQLAGLYPLTYLFQRFKLGSVLGIFIVAWGIIAMLTAAVTTYEGLYAQRFFLGFAESIVPTAFMVIISGYYTQREQTSRQCAWYSSTGGWTVMGALINYGFAHIHTGALHNWQVRTRIRTFPGHVTYGPE